MAMAHNSGHAEQYEKKNEKKEEVSYDPAEHLMGRTVPTSAPIRACRLIMDQVHGVLWSSYCYDPLYDCITEAV